ncbi:hypothetical protein BJV78DRAFT_19938 [Lactifluus subvellereus]|nr:hypothetical protein BJV78DRAFT_19938 [Lactifluus subvellereus]
MDVGARQNVDRPIEPSSAASPSFNHLTLWMVNLLGKALQQQVGPLDSEELRNWSPSRHIQDSRSDRYHLTAPRHILHAEELQPDATATHSPCTHISSATFDTFRANSGQSLSSESSRGEVGEKLRLQRQSSLSSLLSPPSQARATEELISLLGDVNGKLRARATLQSPDQNFLSRSGVDPLILQTPINTTTLERARPRPRVELNLRLSSDTFVQGQSISGNLVVRVRDHSRGELPVLLANSKLRVVGFEYLADSPTFHVFFHHSCPFNELSYASEQIFSESPDYADEEGYREAREGLHLLPFEMTLPVDSCFGKPKGVIDVPGGASVRYIIMASINIKNSNTNRLSLAHFYRSCSIWPPLSLQEVLIPSTRPLVSTAVMSFSHGGSRSKLRLSARVARPSYFSGQRCYVHIQIWNDTRKTVRSLRLTLIRTTTVYRPRPGPRSHRGEHSVNDHISSASYQAKAFVDEISESRLVMAERTTRRCVSSKGWWAGVNPQERTAFTHRILIPPDALSIARSKLLAVDHAIRVTVYASAGTLGLTSRLSVTLPIRVVSMLSVDPPAPASRPPDILVSAHPNEPSVANDGLDLRESSGPENRPDSPPPYRTRPPSLEHPLGITVSDGDLLEASVLCMNLTRHLPSTSL